MKRILVFLVAFAVFTWVFNQENISAQTGIISQTAKKNTWNGVWKVPSRFTGSVLTIKKQTTTKFNFVIEAFNGANLGEITGIAEIKGNKAYFDDRESIGKNAEKYGCRLTFTLKKSFINLDQTSECSAYAGNAVYFIGEFYKGSQNILPDDFVSNDVFPNHALDRKFKSLVGSDYETFLNAFHLIFQDDDNADDFDAKVISACVRGICPYNAAIIVFDTKGNLWAAVLTAEDEEKTTVNYYSNVADWTDKLPKTIENWVGKKMELNNNLIVIYKNKK